MFHQYEHYINKCRHRFLDERFEKLRLKSPDGFLLVRIDKAKVLKMSQLIAELPFHKSHVTRAIFRLHRQGMVTKTADPEDLRGYILKITPLGEKTATEVIGAINDWDNLVNSALTKDEIALIEKTREKIYLFLKNYFEEDTDEKNT